MKLRGDRFGGVVFDVQQHRKGEATFVPQDTPRAIQREKLIHVISTLITMVEEIDDVELHEDSNPRIGAADIDPDDIRPRIAGKLLPTPHQCKWPKCQFMVIDGDDHCTGHRAFITANPRIVPPRVATKFCQVRATDGVYAGYVCAGDEGHDGMHYVTCAGEVVYRWKVYGERQ